MPRSARDAGVGPPSALCPPLDVGGGPTHRSYASAFASERGGGHGGSRRKLRAHIDATLGRGGGLAEAVRLPPGEDVREWVAAHAVDFYGAIAAAFQSLAEEYCTDASCPTMSAGMRFEYRWREESENDGSPSRPRSSRGRAIALSAPAYVSRLFRWIERQLDDARLFPQRQGEPFAPEFDDAVRLIFKRLFRVLAHIYHTHFHHVASLGVAAHLNTCFKHFVLFTLEFDLIDARDMLPLEELVKRVGGAAAARADEAKREETT